MAKQLSKLCGVVKHLQRAAVECRPLVAAAAHNWGALSSSELSSTALMLSAAPPVCSGSTFMLSPQSAPDGLVMLQTYTRAADAVLPWANSRRFSSTSDAEPLPGDKDTDLALKLSEVGLHKSNLT
jgi:hypothetical protein